MGYCPFSVLGRDLEMVSRQDKSGEHDRAWRLGVLPSAMRATAQQHAQRSFGCAHDTDPSLGRDINFCVATWLRLGLGWSLVRT